VVFVHGVGGGPGFLLGIYRLWCVVVWGGCCGVFKGCGVLWCGWLLFVQCFCCFFVCLFSVFVGFLFVCWGGYMGYIG